MGLYKKKYAIGIYKKETKNQTDELIFLAESIQELAEYISANIDKTYVIANQHFSGKIKDFVLDGKLCEMHFIDMTESD